MYQNKLILPFLIATFVFISCRPATTGDFIFSNVHVVDVVHGELIPGQDVIIEGNVIKAILDHGESDVSSGQIIDGSGSYLIPGLWDMHVHLRARKLSPKMREMLNVQLNDLDVMIAENRDLLPLFVAHGVTSVHEMGSDIIDSLVVWQEQTRSSYRS